MAKTYIPTDPLFGAQWHLLNTGQDIMGVPQAEGAYRNDINVTGVWPDYTGKGVVVGVGDDGFQTEHPDLAPNFLTDLSYDLGKNTWGVNKGEHGTSTSGLIIADDNDIGGVGVAFDAKAIGYGHANAIISFSKSVTLMLMAGVDISSNSWTYDVDWEASSGDKSVARQSLANLSELGRDGLGTVTVFAAGNYAESNKDTNQYLTTNSPYSIVVGAALSDGTTASYTTPGASVLIAAPSGAYDTSGSAPQLKNIVTTDLLGTAGINKNPDGDYTNVLAGGSTGFTGTSASAPIVAGVVALMLEANPNLGYRDVQEILAYSARNPEGGTTWQTNGATDWNGGGLLYNNDVGFGLIDALAAVRLAETWEKKSVYGNIVSEQKLLTDDPVTFDTFITVASGETRVIEVDFDTALRVQHAAGDISIENTAGKAVTGVTVTLTGPGGVSQSTLLNPYSASSTSKLGFDFDSVHQWGEVSTSGHWTLTISNSAANAAITVMAGLKLIGDAVPAGETFVYTDDYGRLGTEDTERTILSSTQSGPHTLNAAAVTSDTTVNLCCDEANIAGVDTYFMPDMRFARVVTGDGNDTLTGDEGDTVFFTGRGTNSVDGGGGHDTLQFLWDFKTYSQTAYGIQTVIVGADSLDYATDIDALQFADGTLTLGHDPLVNDLFYAGQVASLLDSGATAESHYDSVGWKAGLDPNAVFDTSAYLANHAALKAAGTNPLDYFHETGWKNGDDPSARFDTSLYLKLNPDVAAAGVDPLQHYLQYGIHEGREVRPVVDSAHLQDGGAFDGTFYLLANEDVAAAGANPYEHWLTYGQKEGRDPNAYFDVSYYLAANPDVAAAGANPLQHYMTYGWKEGRDPSANFDTEGYLDHYADVAAAGIDPLVHYLVYGIGEGRQSTWDLA